MVTVETEPKSAPHSELPPAGWYAEPGSGRQRWWDGTAWGAYAQAGPQAAAPVTDARSGMTILVLGYIMAGASLLIPFLLIPGVVLGIITCTKPGRSVHGAAIICLNLVIGVIAWAAWAAYLAPHG